MMKYDTLVDRVPGEAEDEVRGARYRNRMSGLEMEEIQRG